jgi:hypothetical protein
MVMTTTTSAATARPSLRQKRTIITPGIVMDMATRKEKLIPTATERTYINE